MYVHVCRQTCTMVHVWRSKQACMLALTFCFEAGSLTVHSVFQAGRPASLRGALCLHLLSQQRSAGITDVCHHAWLLHGFWGVSTQVLTCVQQVIYPLSSLRPHLQIFKRDCLTLSSTDRTSLSPGSDMAATVTCCIYCLSLDYSCSSRGREICFVHRCSSSA